MSPIRWNEPRFDEEELKEVSEVIQRSYVNEGPKTKELEDQLKNYLGVKHVILAANATAGLFLATKADSLIRGISDFEVIVPDLTMFATASAVNWAGGKPVIVDVESERFTIDVSKIEEKITKKTIAIMPVHILGREADMDELRRIAKKHNLSIIEDAAGALGSRNKESYLGTLGTVGVYSLQSNKIITSGQGAIIVTNNEKYYEIMRRLRDFGRFSNKEMIHQQEGYNLKFNDLAAALAIAQLKKIELRKSMLLRQYGLYKKDLEGVKEITFPSLRILEGEVPLWIDVIVEKRTDLIEFLMSKEIFPRECWPALHNNPPYEMQGNDALFPVSSFISRNVLWLPNGPGVKEEDIQQVCRVIRGFYNS